MRKFATLLLLAGLLAACNNNKTGSENIKDISARLTKVLGSFVGAFGDNKITLLITRAEGDLVEGRSIVGGNDRPFKGTLKEKTGLIPSPPANRVMIRTMVLLFSPSKRPIPIS